MFKHWALESIDAMARGDAARLEAGVRLGDVNLKTRNGGFGGFRLVASDLHDGETLLHVAMRKNSPKAIVECLLRAGIDVASRNPQGQTARDLNPSLHDRVLPAKRWTPRAFVAWAGSTAPHLEYRSAWLRVFEVFRVDGPICLGWTEDTFQDWVQQHLADLTRAGLASHAVEEETVMWLFEFERLKADMKRARRI